jgi:hypothetical protein
VSIKNEMQEHLWREFEFSHRIDIEPTPSHPVSWSEMNQRLRKINFDINKRHLRTKYCFKWKPADKFWFVGWKQGGQGTGSESHYHLLLHTPANHQVDVWTDLYCGWFKGAGANPMTGKRRPFMDYRKDRFHFGSEPLEPHFLFRVEPVRNVAGSVLYNSRQMHPKMERIEDFVCVI